MERRRYDPGPRLHAGQHIWMAGLEWEVLRVTQCSASVKCVGGRQVGTRHVEFANGDEADFAVCEGGYQAGATLSISPHSFVEVV